MLTDRFGSISRLFASRRTRRAALDGGTAALAAIVAPLVPRALAQDAAPMATVLTVDPNKPHPGAGGDANAEYLFVQPFMGGTWAPKDGADGAYTLTLTGTAANTVSFSDRPDRIVGLVPTGKFLDGLGFTPENPPNAALVAQTGAGEQEVLVIELLNPDWDTSSGTLIYEARVLANYGEPGLAHLAQRQANHAAPITFAHGGLFIDDCPDIAMNCLEIDISPAEVVGATTIHQCFNTATNACLPCRDPGALCMEAFPDPCKKHVYDWVNDVWVDEHACTGRFD